MFNKQRRSYKKIPSTRTVSVSRELWRGDNFLDSAEAPVMGTYSDSYWRIVLILLFIVICLMVALIVSALVPALLEKPGQAEKAAGDICQSKSYNIDTALPKEPYLFQDLSKDELTTVRDYLLSNSSLNLTRYEKASLNSNFIFLIELYLPLKSDALRYLNKGGKKPVRRARVIIVNGAKAVPDVEELVVYPLPNPTSYQKLVLSNRMKNIPYTSRPFSVLELKGHFGLVTEATSTAYRLLKESFDYWYHNCTTRCLVSLPIGSPGTVAKGKRRSWLTFIRRLPGQFLHAVPFELYIDHTEADPSKWRIIAVMYANQYFSSVSELMNKYNTNSLVKLKIAAPTEEDIKRGWFARRGASFINPPLRPPIIFEPNGKRYSVKGRKVKYSGWEFDVGIRSSAGPAVYDIKFNDSRIAYELSIQEAASFYSSFGPKQSSAQYMDSQGRLGASNMELIKGIDCPEDATFLETVNFMDTGEPVASPRSMCIFEMNMGIPTRRHTEVEFTKDSTGIEGLAFAGGLVDYALVVRTVSTPLNYDFIFDYIFHQNGVIESRTSTAGYLQTTYYDNREKAFGYQHFPSITGSIHDHFILYKVDLDIDGPRNTFQTLDVVTRNISYPWEAGTSRTVKEISRNIRKYENESLIRFDFDRPKYYVVHNEESFNRYRNPKGYRIQPQYMVKQLYGDDYFVTKAAAWTKYQIAVSRYKDSERFGSCVYGQYGAAEPVCNFDEMFKDNEAIENSDLVAWVVVGGLHVPNTEDVPTTITTGNHFTVYLKPFGFFDTDPTMGSTDAVLVTRKHGKLNTNTFGTPTHATCKISDRKFAYGG